jgi:hypothetical protein
VTLHSNSMDDKKEALKTIPVSNWHSKEDAMDKGILSFNENLKILEPFNEVIELEGNILFGAER